MQTARKEIDARYLAKHPEKNSLCAKSWRARNPEKVAAYAAARREKNAEAARRWRETNSNRVEEYKIEAAGACRRWRAKRSRALRAFDQAETFVSTISNINKLANLIAHEKPN